MEITIYRCQGDNELRLSLAFEVDQFVWRQQDLELEVLMQTRSIGKAFYYVKKQQYQGYSSLSRSKPIWFCNQPIDPVEAVYDACEGRALLISEIEENLDGNNLQMIRANLLQTLQILFLQGRLTIQPAVELDHAVINWKCKRCEAGVSHLYESSCATCGQSCVMCQHCYLLGKSRSCMPLFLFEKRVQCSDKKDISLSALHYTPWQQRVTHKVERFLLSPEKKLLLWAATGAGKTEVMIPVIASALRNRKRILWVTPRKDVVLELLPRLRQIFYKERILGVYGGSKEIWKKEDMVIATAHQALRYYQYFDFVIVDEVDSFPLYRNHMLESGIRRAMTPQAKEVYLTATPPKEWDSLQGNNHLQVIKLPLRYHGKPLPVPKIIYEWHLWKKVLQKKQILSLNSFIEQTLATGGQAMIFVPRIHDVHTVCTWLREQFPHLHKRIAGVHGQMADREKTIMDFRDQHTDIIVTTTVLERGVTVPTVHVLVLAAEHNIFDRATLIQIAGRVGRDSDYQLGEVWFITSQKTEAQVQAIRECKQLNHLAKKEVVGNQGVNFQ